MSATVVTGFFDRSSYCDRRSDSRGFRNTSSSCGFSLSPWLPVTNDRSDICSWLSIYSGSGVY